MESAAPEREAASSVAVLRAVLEDLETTLLRKALFTWPKTFFLVESDVGVKADCWGAIEYNVDVCTELLLDFWT